MNFVLESYRLVGIFIIVSERIHLMQVRSEETCLHILEASYQLFSQHGYEGTSVAEICVQAGVSKGAFYHHFPSKQAVFIALMNEWLAGLDQAFNTVQEQSLNMAESIVLMADTAGSVLQASDVHLKIILEFWMQAVRDPDIWKACIAPYSRYQAYVADLVRIGIQEGSVRNVDPDLAARVTVSLAMGLLLQALFEPPGIDWGLETRQSLQLLMDGIARKDR